MAPRRLNSQQLTTYLSARALKRRFAAWACNIPLLPSNVPHTQLTRSCSRYLKIQADTTDLPSETEDYSIVVVPGGAKGAATLSQSSDVQSLLRKFVKQNKFVGTICAGSLAIKTTGLILGGHVTSHPSVATEFEGYKYSQERVVVEGRVISSRGLSLTRRC